MPEIKIGLEIHVYIDVSHTKQKLFCPCIMDPEAEPNTTICPRCTGQPGSKPLLPNKEAVEKVIKTALMLNCKINRSLLWQRKHYSWPDLPKGYQSTMSGSYAVPVGENGEFLGIRIRECHLEEDPARWDPNTGTVDYNRSGYPLIEIVTEPDFKEIVKVRHWLQNLITTLSYVQAIDKDAGVKCDVNISIAPKFERVEIKNVNSFTSIIKSIEYEVCRQEQLIKEGKKVSQETRAWVDAEGVTKFMRSKENAVDYMFIPEPDLPAVEITAEMLSRLNFELPEKPAEKEKKMLKNGVSSEDAKILSADLLLAELWEELSSRSSPAFAAKWLRKELMRVLHDEEKSFPELKIRPEHLAELLSLLENKKINEETGRKLLSEMAKKDFSPEEKVKEKGLGMVSNQKELENFCRQAIKNSSQAVADYQRGEEKAVDFIVGQVMKLSRGKADPKEVKNIIKKLIS